MNVKKPFDLFKKLKVSRFLLIMVLLLIIGLAYSQWSEKPETDWQEDQVELAMRHLGDKLLKQYGDGESPIPPISQLSNYSFSLNLPQPIALNPDDLVGVALKTFDKAHFQKAIVQVYAGQAGDMVYAFNLDTYEQGEIPCLGRVLPEDHYYVHLKVLDLATNDSRLQVAMMGIAGFGLVVMLLAGFSRLPEAEKKDAVEIAGMQLDQLNGFLLFEGKQIQLTQKEANLAFILMQQPGQLVTREYLVEQVWSKEGVITGRSLDVFISRLRKKLAINPQVQIVNKHGKGYVFEVKT